MIMPKFEYRKADSVTAAIALFEGFKGQASYLAGGTDLIPRVKSRLAMPAAVIDLKGIEALRTISRQGGALVIGANTTLFELKNDATVKEYFPALQASLEATSCEALQMRGTIGGNILQNTRCLFYNQSLAWRTARGLCFKMGGEICNAAPGAKRCFSNYCSDNALPLLTLSAALALTGPQGERKIKLEKLFSSKGKNPFTLLPGEILTGVHIPLKKSQGAYEKLRVRGSIDYPLVGAACSVLGGKGKIAVGGIGLEPLVYDLKDLTEATLKEAADKASQDAKPVANAVLTPAYRKKMVRVLAQRAISKTVQEGK